MTKKLTLGKNERLKSSKQIGQLFSDGKKFAINPFRVFYLFDENIKASLQFGVGVSSKNFKKAVDRNRIKRLIKETYRLQKIQLQNKIKHQGGELNMFVIYTGKELPVYKDVYEQMEKVINKLFVLINKSD